ncbi:putative vacuolar protein sorting-associated protein 11 [Triangularia setosa]|uniref:E3 ubiquitin-protein ligase PEP5 n=1 Tax=Triangularia setosa TaxID=2587417 RepID=A0AAN6W4K8_9PEZI|nr:putative vacuolar protein sorting-associated protein 11 [Podospora setosa]
MALTWRSFDFFESTPITPSSPASRSFFDNPSSFSQSIASVCSGSESLFLGGFDGTVRIIGPNFKILRQFTAYDNGSSVTHMRQVEGTSLLVTIGEGGAGEDLEPGQPVIKVWSLDKVNKKDGAPGLLSSVIVNNGKRPFPISAFTATEDLTQLAVGFANGAVTVIRGDMIHDLGTKQRVIYESDEPITGVEMHVEAGVGLTTLFVATTARVLKVVISGKGHGQPPKTVEDEGCGVGCMVVDRRTGEIVVAREDAVYYYTLEGRGPPTAYEGAKKLVAVYGDYVALVSPPTPAGETDTTRRRFWGAAADNIYTFTLIHPELRIIAHSETVLADVKHIFALWGDLYMLTLDGKIFRYHEKTLQQRLDMLYQRNLYTLAVDLAQKCGMEAQQQNIIYRKYGDYLYQKGNYDEAMTQYIKAIDSTEPSQVIRNFLDTQRIHNLIEYLEELHEHHKATSDHTTLLLNCYAKLKDIDKLEKFIKSEGDLKFDLDTAISMCRQGGYYEQAAYLAKKHGEHDLVVDILIEDSKAYNEALDFIWHLDPETAHPCLMKYARVLIEHCPSDATQLFIDYYTGKYKPRIDVPITAEAAPVTTNGGFAAGAANAVSNLSSLLPLPYMNTTAIANNNSANAKPTVGDLAIKQDVIVIKYTPPKPRTAFSSFIDHPDEFIVFLEACLQDDALSKEDKTDIYTTLFEMYLHKSNEKKSDSHREKWEAKAKSLIEADKSQPLTQERPQIENSNVLLLSHLSNFQDGTTLVKEQSGLLFDIFRSYTSAKDTKGAIKALAKYGPEEPQLYPAALSYLTSDAKILDEAGPDELASVLEKIDKGGLMAPLQVVQTLSKNSVASMGMIKPYLAKRIEAERLDIQENKRVVNQFRTETVARRQEIADLGGKPAVFQATRCGQCSGALELPVVHFLCKHSFHRRCLRVTGEGGNNGEDVGECPICAMDSATIRALKKSQEENAERHELFRADLEMSEDRFRTVAEWFGRGVMGGTAGVE